MKGKAEFTRRFLSIFRKLNSPGVKAAWVEPSHDGTWARYTTDDPEAQADDFNDAMQTLGFRACDYLGLTTAQRLRVQMLGIKLIYDADNEYKVVLTAAMEVKGFTTPILLRLPKATPADEFKTEVQAIIKAANHYLEGKKLQPSLFTSQEDEDVPRTTDAEEPEGEAEAEGAAPSEIPFPGKGKRVRDREKEREQKRKWRAQKKQESGSDPNPFDDPSATV